MQYELFDAWFSVGDPFMGHGAHEADAIKLMGECGITRAVSPRAEQAYAHHIAARAAAVDMANQHDPLYGLIPIYPPETEGISASSILKDIYSPKIAGLHLDYFAPRIPGRPVFFAAWLKLAVELKLPVWYHAADDFGFAFIADIMDAFPGLRVVLNFSETWPCGQKVYPLLTAHRGLHLCLAPVIFMGAIEDICQKFGAERLLFATDYPRRYIGSAINMLNNADISPAERAAIAGGNMINLLSEVTAP